MLKIKKFVVNPFGMNCYIVYDPVSKDAVVVDPGISSVPEANLFDDFVEHEGLKIKQIVNTHLHLDHCFGNNYVRSKYGVKIAAHPADALLGKRIDAQARQFGIRMSDDSSVEIDVPLAEGDTIEIGSDTLMVLHVPGHSPGSIALYSPTDKFVIVGDVLFRGSIGRTDLAGGDHSTLITSIQNKLLTLPDDTQVLPGHEAPTTIGREKMSNPFIR